VIFRELRPTLEDRQEVLRKEHTSKSVAAIVDSYAV
jgi:hypothetical protein